MDLREQIFKIVEKVSQQYLSVDKKCAFCNYYMDGLCKGQLEYDRRDCPKRHTSRKRRTNEGEKGKETDGE